MYAPGELRIVGRLHQDPVAASDAAHGPDGDPILLITGLIPAPPAELAGYVRWSQRFAACSRHPHIAEVVCYGVHDGRPYLGVRTGQRRTLAEWLAARGPMPYQQVRMLGGALADALATAHAAGLCHLAVRPEVVYLDQRTGPVLAGFDAGAPVLVRPMATGPLSAPEFRVPRGEIGTGGPVVGPATDVYALCATLHLALGGPYPPPGGTAWPDPAAPTSNLPDLPGVPRGFLDLLRRGLAGHPEHRPTAIQLREALLKPWDASRRPAAPADDDLRATLGGPVTPLLPPAASPDDQGAGSPVAVDPDQVDIRPLVGAWRVETEAGSQELLMVTEQGTVIWTGSDDAGPFVATGEALSLGDGGFRLLLNEPAGSAGFYVDLRITADGWSFLMDHGPADGLVGYAEP